MRASASTAMTSSAMSTMSRNLLAFVFTSPMSISERNVIIVLVDNIAMPRKTPTIISPKIRYPSRKPPRKDSPQAISAIMLPEYTFSLESSNFVLSPIMNSENIIPSPAICASMGSGVTILSRGPSRMPARTSPTREDTFILSAISPNTFATNSSTAMLNKRLTSTAMRIYCGFSYKYFREKRNLLSL